MTMNDTTQRLLRTLHRAEAEHDDVGYNWLNVQQSFEELQDIEGLEGYEVYSYMVTEGPITDDRVICFAHRIPIKELEGGTWIDDRIWVHEEANDDPYFSPMHLDPSQGLSGTQITKGMDD
jgi:hypothetical protein